MKTCFVSNQTIFVVVLLPLGILSCVLYFLSSEEIKWWENGLSPAIKETPVYLSKKPSEPPERYYTEHGSLKEGKLFNISDVLWGSLKLPPERYVSLANISWNDIVFVTGASENHFKEVQDTVGSAQKWFPAKRIIFFDIGLTAASAEQVKTWCSVEYRKFNFDIYPPHVRSLWSFAWKLLAVQQVLLEEPGCFYFDSSIRFFDNNISTLWKIVISGRGSAFPSNLGMSVFSFTAPVLCCNDLKSTISKGFPVLHCVFQERY